MSMEFQTSKAQILRQHFINSDLPSIELFVAGMGWLVLLRENIEIVSDNWFASSKYIASEILVPDDAPTVLKCKNVYQVNLSYTDNPNNVKYNLLFEELSIFVDQIIAFH
ncbi:hypothetical protein KHM83_12080 [Fusibacter paucivorans]|uniref:Uncharacterized protein n=1 Tax=Fusibacter paucivorans TaxID=76009 RepID=A0ABS5PQG6_9FIRM|nr:hypothetical protein [Fusibacter paucivorans]MBS7527413.1 hypothetical protein [Fusibacter paucivorans]